MRTQSNQLRILTLAALLIVGAALLIPVQSTGSAPRAMAPQDELDKEAMHARMKELQSRIDDLLKQYGQSQSPDVRAELDAAQQEFDSISAQLGGDRPVPEGADDREAQPLEAPAEPQVVATAPVGCPMTTSNFSAAPNIRIPTSGTSGTRTTTISVSGIGTSIWDVDAITTLTHTACADLDITLKSPAGTIVTLTTDNGGTNDNVFNGTLWDDQANPGGQVPYSSNNGVASDHAYTNNTLASPIVPEESLGAFIGEDPNGTWTLTITDDSSGDIGNLASWSINITTLGAGTFTTQAVFPSSDPNLPSLVSNSCLSGPVTSAVMVSGLGLHVGRIRLTTQITHFNPGDLDITLTSPQGTVTTLTTDNGTILAPTAFDGTTFDSRANLGGQVPYGNCLIFFPCNQGLATDRIYSFAGTASALVPEESMGSFLGENPNGVWTLKVVDDSCNLLVGSLKAWSLDITTTTCCAITCPANITQGNDPGMCGANVSFSPMDNGYCGMVACSPASGTFFPKGTTTVNCTTSAGPGCSFTVTVNDTEPPMITCPANVTAVTPRPCNTTGVVTYAAPMVTDNCPGATVMCVPPSGSSFAVGVTTVTCTATDTSGNTANCSFTVTLFDVRLQDDSSPSKVILFNSFTGDYRICCGTMLAGKGTIEKKGCLTTLTHNAVDRRVKAIVDPSSQNKGNASWQSPPGTMKCTIYDRDIRNDTMLCQ
ncbi:MAG TPA: proprotein convertase P-domain-containing protein [Blastocatellia bacterium]|nr:proprotein convertase P-domain-containing protein [Blastocatellia bacterium]